MNDPVVNAVLEGGPAGLTGTERVHTVPAAQEKIKVPFLGGREHFERSADLDDPAEVVVYRWIGRTENAE